MYVIYIYISISHFRPLPSPRLVSRLVCVYMWGKSWWENLNRLWLFPLSEEKLREDEWDVFSDPLDMNPLSGGAERRVVSAFASGRSGRKKKCVEWGLLSCKWKRIAASRFRGIRGKGCKYNGGHSWPGVLFPNAGNGAVVKTPIFYSSIVY